MNRNLALSLAISLILIDGLAQGIIILPNGRADVPAKFLTDCYQCVVERDSSLYREKLYIKKDSLSDIQIVQLLDEKKTLKTKVSNRNKVISVIGIIVIITEVLRRIF